MTRTRTPRYSRYARRRGRYTRYSRYSHRRGRVAAVVAVAGFVAGLAVRLLRAVVSAALLLLIVAGTPVALARFFGWPLPHHLPSRADWELWLREPLTAAFGTGVLACLLWLAWAAFCYTVVADLVGRARRRARRLRLPRLRTGGTVQTLAGSVVGAVVVALPGTATAAPPPAPVPPDAATAVTDPATGPTPDPAIDMTTHPATHTATGMITRPATGVAPPATPSPGSGLAAARARVVAAPVEGWWVRGGWVALPAALAIVAVWKATIGPDRLKQLNGRYWRERPRLVVAALLHRTDRHPIRPPVPTDPGGAGLEAAARLPAGGIGLTGATAADAVRGLLITLLLGRPGTVTILTTVADWTLLAGDTPPPPEVTVCPDLPAALDRLDQHLDQQLDQQLDQHIEQHSPPTPSEASASHSGIPAGGDGRPTAATAGTPDPVVLLASAPGPADAARAAHLAAALRSGRERPVAAALIGSWAHGTTYQVDHAGRLDPPPATGPRRVTVLSAAGCADILATLNPPTPDGDDSGGAGRPAADTAEPPPDPPPRPLRLRVLGPPQLTRAGTDDPVRLPRRAALEILTLLALHRDGLDRDTILESVGPQAHHHAAVIRLHSAVSSLRGATTTVTALPLIVHRGGRYRLEPGTVNVDLWHLNDALQAAVERPDPHRWWHALELAAGGELAAGAAWPWLAPYRARLHDQIQAARAALGATRTDPSR